MADEKQIGDREIILHPDGQNPNDGGGSVMPYNMHELYAMYGNAYFDMFPPGYRFKPTGEKLLVHYLMKKILNEPLPPNRIEEVELYKRNPQDLAENYTCYQNNEWYFFTTREREHKNEERPSRSAGDGYWRATGADRPVKHNGVQVGSKRVLVFYVGKPPNGDKTDWIMHEYTVGNHPNSNKSEVENDLQLDEWVLCRLYKKVDKNSEGPGQVTDEESENEVPPQFKNRGKMPIVKESSESSLFSSDQEQLNDHSSDDPGASTSVISPSNDDQMLNKHL